MELDVSSLHHPIQPCRTHKEGREKVTERKHLLGRYPAVGHDAEQCRHKEGDYTLHGIEQTDLLRHTNGDEVTSHRGEVGTPYGELQEVHHD